MNIENPRQTKQSKRSNLPKQARRNKSRSKFVEAIEPRCLLSAVPTPAHVVVVIEENHSYDEVIGNGQAPYINSLAGQGALFSSSFAVDHPSQPNYLAIFSGSEQGISDDNPTPTFNGPNLGSELIAAGQTFGGYSEDLPSVGSKAITSGGYARKHNPWSDFSNVPSADNMPFTSFPSDFTTLPTVSFVVPNLTNDMHDGTVQQGDQWLQANMSAYATWAQSHNSLLIVTWDEDDSSQSNQIPTIFYGQGVNPGTYGETIDHYSVLRTIEDMYSLPAAGQSAGASSIQDIWSSSQTSPPTIATAANASASGTTASLSVLGADAAGENSLTYTWATVGTPPAAVKFSVNGTNASKNTVATFSKAGTYNFQVTVTDVSGQTVSSTVTAVVSQTLTSLTLTPSTVTVTSNATQQFSVAGKDQFGNAMAGQPAVTWSVNAGTVSASGLYTAPSTGSSATVKAASGSMSATASVTVQSSPPSVATPAGAVVSTSTAALSVLGADANGENILSYTWGTVGTPPAPVTFSVNGTNAAKNAVATFSKAGTYNLRVTITDTSGQTVTSSVTAVVNQILASLTLSPSTVTLSAGATRQFSAAGQDQFGNAMASQLACTWSANAGTISASGLYTAPSSGGSDSVQAVSGTISATASITLVQTSPPSLATPASAVVALTNATLSVLGADADGESTLTYTWTTLGALPAPVAFSANDSNAAKDTVASFSKAGTYNFQVTITDASGETVTSGVTAVVDQTLTGLTLSPSTATVTSGATQQFSVVTQDQFGNAMASQPAFTWSASAGTISPSGLYTAPATGGASTVQASSGAASASANVTVVQDPVDPVSNNVVYLSDLSPTSATIGWGSIHQDASVEGNALTLHGVTYAKGIGTHANSQIVYTLNGQYSQFVCDVGVDDEVLPARGSISFKVLGDGVVLYQSGVLTNRSATAHIDISVSGVKTLTLVARNGVRGSIDYDHADWAGAMLTTGAAVANNNPPSVASPAAGTVSSTTAALSVLGADDAGEPNLTYTWAPVGTPPAPVSFSINGTNAAKNALAMFAKAGTYNLQVTIRDGLGLSATSKVTVTVKQVLTTLSVSPTSMTLAVGDTRQLIAIARDQFGNAMSPQPTIGWSVTGGGTVSTAGLYTAPSAATDPTVTATMGGLNASASITVDPAPPPNQNTTPGTGGNTTPGITATSLQPPSTLNWSGPIVITTGGTYTGNWQSLSANTPAVDIETTQPVIIVNSNIESMSTLISAQAGNADVTIKNTHGWALNPNVSGQSPGRFLDAENFSNLDIENNTLVGTAGIEMGYWQGGGTVKVLYNNALNIDGRWSDGHGGFQTGANANDLVQFAQFNHCVGMSGVEIAWNQVINLPGQSRVEDNISVFQTSGTSSSPILIHDNYIDGAYPVDPANDSSFSGGGIMLSDGWTGSAATDSGNVQAYNNFVIDTGNYGMAIASGRNDVIYNNTVISSGVLPSGQKEASQNVGIYVWNQGDPNFANGQEYGNTIGWMGPSGRNDSWTPNASGQSGDTLLPGTITLAQQQSYYSIWAQQVSTAGMTIGAA